jgi:ribosomal protein S18 acetylase RimI-like enzyme
MTPTRITLRRGLAGAERDAARALVELCNRHERLDLPAMLDAEGAGQLLAHAGDELQGLAMLQDGPEEAEALVLVHPGHRRRGLGRALLDAAQEHYRRQGHAALLLVCDESSPSGQRFVAATGAARHHAEHRMRLDPAAVDSARPRPPGYAIRPADASDRALLERLQAEAFGDTPDEARTYIAAGLADPTRQYFVGAAGGEPVGLLRLGRYEALADITAFGVLPARRGQGYGRAMLQDAVAILLAERWEQVVIEVFTDNDRALGLYESCGFRVTATYGYYALSL